MQFRDRVILVSGASRGIGAAIARAFAAEGGFVVVNYLRSQQAAEQVVQDCHAAGGQAWALRADVTDAAAVQDMVAQVQAELGRIDVLVHNAFAPYRFDPAQRKRFWETGWDDYQTQFDGAVRSAYLLSQAVLPLMRQRACGSIVHIASDLVERPVLPYHDYATAKAALVGFTRHLAAELGPLGIRVNAVAPGLVYPTEASRATREDVQEAIVAQTPLRRVARPEDVAGPVLFLASDWSRFVTGQLLLVDGGLMMK